MAEKCDMCGLEIKVPTTPEAWFWDYFDDEVFEEQQTHLGYSLGKFVAEKLTEKDRVELCGKCIGTITEDNRDGYNKDMEKDRLDYIASLRKNPQPKGDGE